MGMEIFFIDLTVLVILIYFENEDYYRTFFA
jgi:hypothetical protein